MPGGKLAGLRTGGQPLWLFDWLRQTTMRRGRPARKSLCAGYCSRQEGMPAALVHRTGASDRHPRLSALRTTPLSFWTYVAALFALGLSGHGMPDDPRCCNAG